MSTKATIVYGKTFHFYNECLDNQHVYLELEGTHYEAGYNRVMVPIPIHIWEVIRHQGGADLSLATKTDSELESLAAERVDKRIEGYAQSKENGLRRFLYFGADRPRDEQLAEELERLRARRKEQQEIAAAIEEIRTYDPRVEYAKRKAGAGSNDDDDSS
jgi:hypothetical protein